MEASDQISQKTSEIIDSEVKNLVDQAYKEVKELIIKHKEKLEAIAKKLLERETLTGDEVKAIFEGKELKDSETPDLMILNLVVCRQMTMMKRKNNK